MSPRNSKSAAFCTDCHDPHARNQEAQIRTTIVEDGVAIHTEVENNTLCLSCHATHGPFEEISPEMVADYEAHEVEIGEVVSAHTNHPYAPERAMGLSRCVQCHMPLTVGRGMLTGRPPFSLVRGARRCGATPAVRSTGSTRKPPRGSRPGDWTPGPTA